MSNRPVRSTRNLTVFYGESSVTDCDTHMESKDTHERKANVTTQIRRSPRLLEKTLIRRSVRVAAQKK